MKKKLANYLAFWSNLWFSSFVVHLLSLIAAAIAIVVMAKIAGSYDTLGVKITLYFIYFLFIHGTIVGILSFFLISKKESGWQYWELLRNKENKVFVLGDKAIPHTGYRYTIEKPNNYCDGTSEAKFNTWLSARHRNSKITIPVIIRFKMKSVFDVAELFTVLFNVQGPGPDFDFHQYVIDYFMKINANSLPPINKLIIDYADSKMSEPDVLNSIIDLLTFPERPFIGVENVSISLGEPEITVCKGQGCEN